MSASPRTMLAAAAAGVLLVVGVVWLALRAPQETGEGARRADEVAAPAPVASEPSAPTSVAEPELREDVESAAAAPGSRVRPRKDATWATVWLVGALELRQGGPEDVTLLVRPGDRVESQKGLGASRVSWGKPATDASFRIDVSAAFPRGAEVFPKVLTLQVIRDGFRPTEVEVEVLARPSDGSDAELAAHGETDPLEPIDGEALRSHPALAIDAGRVLVRETCTLAGHAWIADDDELSVEVAAFELVDGAPRADCDASATASAATRAFELKLDCSSRYALVAFADGYRPVTRVIEPGELAPLELELGPGSVLAGHVRHGGRGLECTVLAEHELALGATNSSRWPNVHGTNFVWTGESFEWLARSARTYREGWFKVQGLAPDDYELRLAGVLGVYSKDVARRSVSAPCVVVELAPQVFELRIAATQAGATAAHALVAIRETLSNGTTRVGSARTDAAGQLVLWSEPGARVTVSFGREHEFVCGAAGDSQSVRIGD